MHKHLWNLLFPPKCILCNRVLSKEETDLCKECRKNQPLYGKHKIKLSFLAQWTGLWYYKENVRSSILRYKFSGRRSYGTAYGRLLAMKLLEENWDDLDVLTWVPISQHRKRVRGYDQVEVFARVLAEELGLELVPILKKVRNTKPQSTMGDAAHRRANILGAYTVTDPSLICGKRILLLDDIITTGATASECARVLLTAGAKEVKLATLAVASHEKTSDKSR